MVPQQYPTIFSTTTSSGTHTNRLRERTRIVITGCRVRNYSGITSTDLLDESGNLYVQRHRSFPVKGKQVYTDLLNLTDGNYEKNLREGSTMQQPVYTSVISFHAFSLWAIEHKINFSLTRITVSRIDIDNNTLSGSPKGQEHYTSSASMDNRGRSSGSARRGS